MENIVKMAKTCSSLVIQYQSRISESSFILSIEITSASVEIRALISKSIFIYVITWLILGLRLANERQLYFVTSLVLLGASLESAL